MGTEHRAGESCQRSGERPAGQPEGVTVGTWRRDGGGQGVLSRPEGKGLRAYRARGRATPTEAIESSVVMASINGRVSARMKTTAQGPAKAGESAAEPDRP